MKNPFSGNTKKIADDLFQKFEQMKPKADQVYAIHNNIRRMTNQFDAVGPDMKKVENFNVPNGDFPVPVRLYVPHNLSDETGPCLIYLHGGGFVTCSTESHDGLCRRLASGASLRVLSVDYRLAPQYPYPAGPEDCEAVLKWVLEGHGAEYGLNAGAVALGGDSAGGNMTAYLAQKYRDRLKAQILFYPLMQLVELKPPKPGPQDWLQIGVMALKFIEEHYVAGSDPQDVRLSPLFEKNLIGLPPAYVLTCGLDPLRDEGRAYARNMETAGVRVKYCHERAMPHGFLNFARAFPKGKKVPLDAADFLRETLQ